MIEGLHRNNDKNRKRWQKSRNMSDILVLEGRECEEEEGVMNKAPDRWRCLSPRQVILEEQQVVVVQEVR